MCHITVLLAPLLICYDVFLNPRQQSQKVFLLSHSPIQDVAVIGVPDIKMAGDELPHAYVVANQRKITSDAIKSIVKDNLASHKQLRRGVIAPGGCTGNQGKAIMVGLAVVSYIM
ncbi:uncharacterized protein N7487_009452 [Penicillium crustosum]|uniref:uncharacterized protein n=1 Tax=Penicillium crustosum TaxID=36656 RepID=UPI0023A27748|nr:uncharacterized protein N7487_009452 [Penicillium crustosum]KAJ5395149.1 hypothetical protein N7487_009452 [Penicillium crustosum]